MSIPAEKSARLSLIAILQGVVIALIAVVVISLSACGTSSNSFAFDRRYEEVLPIELELGDGHDDSSVSGVVLINSGFLGSRTGTVVLNSAFANGSSAEMSVWTDMDSGFRLKTVDYVFYRDGSPKGTDEAVWIVTGRDGRIHVNYPFSYSETKRSGLFDNKDALTESFRGVFVMEFEYSAFRQHADSSPCLRLNLSDGPSSSCVYVNMNSCSVVGSDDPSTDFKF